MKRMNLFHIPEPLPQEEVFEALAPDRGVLIERIVSSGQATPQGEWYDQERDEWVALLQGEAVIRFEDGRIFELKSGDYLLIAAHEKHRVERTSPEPPCIWLAVHARILSKGNPVEGDGESCF